MNGKMITKGLVITAVALTFAATSRVYASASISLGADDSTFFGSPTSVPLTAGDGIYVGQFSISDTSIQALGVLLASPATSQSAYSTLVSDFVPLSGVSLQAIGAGETGSQQAGYLAGVYIGNNSAFASGNVYVLAVNTATTAGASQVGVFRGDVTWVYPSSMATGNAVLDTDNSSTALVGSYATGLNGAVWAYNNGDGNDNATLNALDLTTIAAVPEPSSIALVVIGLLGGVGMIRRRRS